MSTIASIVTVDCVIELEYATPEEAAAVLAAISPDNEPYAEAELDGNKVIVRSRSGTAPQMLHTMEDLLACVKVAEEIVKTAR